MIGSTHRKHNSHNPTQPPEARQALYTPQGPEGERSHAMLSLCSSMLSLQFHAIIRKCTNQCADSVHMTNEAQVVTLNLSGKQKTEERKHQPQTSFYINKTNKHTYVLGRNITICFLLLLVNYPKFSFKCSVFIYLHIFD